MKRKEEARLREVINEILVDQIKDSDKILIDDLIDWINIGQNAKADLKDAIKDGEKSNWQILTTIAMASKQIQNIMQKLNITPDKRAKKNDHRPNKGIDLNSFLNEN